MNVPGCQGVLLASDPRLDMRDKPGLVWVTRFRQMYLVAQPASISLFGLPGFNVKRGNDSDRRWGCFLLRSPTQHLILKHILLHPDLPHRFYSWNSRQPDVVRIAVNADQQVDAISTKGES